LYEAAPDMVVLQLEGLEESAGSSGFVPLGKLGGMTAGAPVEQRASPGSADLGEEAGNLMVGS